MTDLDVVRRAIDLIGGGYVAVRPSRKVEHKMAYEAQIYGQPAEDAMRAVLPYMGQRRSAKIREILEMDLSHHPRKVKT
jgi:hypothetical protein